MLADPRSPPPPPPPSPQEDEVALSAEVTNALQRQCLIDTSSRVRNGALLYPVLWLVASQAGGFFREHLLFSLANAGLLLLAGAARWGLHGHLCDVQGAAFDRARRSFRVLSVVQALHWGVLCAVAVLWPAAAPIQFLMVTIGAVVAMGGTMIVAIEPVLAVAYPVAMVGTFSAALLLFFRPENLVLALVAVLFTAYSLAISRVMRDDYWQARKAQVLLAQRAREFELLSLTDPLTQVPNRLAFERRLMAEWAAAKRLQLPLSVAVIDLDHFKQINDTHGHPFGDECLRRAAAALQNGSLRANDEVARYGGEEFVVLLPHSNLDSAVAVAQRLLESLRALRLEHDSVVVLLTCSIGVASLVPGPETSAALLLKQADEALYLAKQRGRNSVVPFRPPEQPSRPAL